MDFLDVYYQTLLNSSNDAIGIFKILGDTIMLETYNENFTKTLVSNASIPKGKSIEEIFDEEFAFEFRKKIKECLCLKRSLKYISTFILNEQTQYCNICLNPLFIEDKIIVFAFSKNITKMMNEQKKNDELLSEYNCLFRVSTNPVCLIQFDENNKLTLERENTAFEEFRKLYSKHTFSVNASEILSSILTEKKQLSGEFRIDLKEGDSLYYSYNIIPIIKEDRVTKAFIKCMNTTEKFNIPKKTEGHITKRETEVLQLVIEGNTNKYIAFKLNITEGTVKKLLFNVYKKLGINSRSELLKLYLGGKNKYSNH